MPKIIGIHGHAGVGKDTLGKYFEERRENCYRLAFADHLKYVCSTLFGISLSSFYDHWKDSPTAVQGKTPRELLQFVGTELIRDRLTPFLGIKNSFWIHYMEGVFAGELPYQDSDPVRYEDDDLVIITDVRFQDEYDWILSKGGYVIHLTRPGCHGHVGITDHASEDPINLHTPERTFGYHNDGTLEALEQFGINLLMQLEY